MVTGTWGLWGHIPVVESILFPSLAAQGSQSLDAAGVYELVVFLWDGSVQRRVLPARKGPAARGPGAEIHLCPHRESRRGQAVPATP